MILFSVAGRARGRCGGSPLNTQPEDVFQAVLDAWNTRDIDRFTSLLQELSEETQFVLITHSKRTMEVAQALYGVTQEEPGVSKIVSVRFD